MSDKVSANEDILSATPEILIEPARRGDIALGWYDLTCPFCYLGQIRSRLIQARGITLVELPFQAHSDIPVGGIHIGERSGALYDRIASDATKLGLPLVWPPRLPNSRSALAAAEWIRRNRSKSFARVVARLFKAHFADGLDIGNMETVLACVGELIGDTNLIRKEIADGKAYKWLADGERLGHKMGVTGTPTWLIGGKLITGFLPEVEFERLIHIEKAKPAN